MSEFLKSMAVGLFVVFLAIVVLGIVGLALTYIPYLVFSILGLGFVFIIGWGIRNDGGY